MEEHLEMEARRQEEIPARDENRTQTWQTSLYRASMIAQWIVLLICLSCFALCYLRSPDPQTQWIYVKSSNHTISYKNPIGIRKKDGTMEVSPSNFIPIHCDGLYLVFLKGTIRTNGTLILMVYYQSKHHFLKINCSGQNAEVKEVVVHEFRSKDVVYLEAHNEFHSDQEEYHEAPKPDLTLSLIMLTPHSYCYPEN